MERKPIVSKTRPKLVLASGSPRRRELLGAAGYAFEVCAPDVDENIQGTPRQMVDALSERKARAAAATRTSGIVLAADTLVAVDGEALGKPVDEEDARRMLRMLSGRAHEVLTGVCLIDAASGRVIKHVATTTVRFRALSGEEIDRYIATGEPMDKAGAYGIQGGAGKFVERIDGSFENVMGLPIEAIPGMIQRFTEEREV